MKKKIWLKVVLVLALIFSLSAGTASATSLNPFVHFHYNDASSSVRTVEVSSPGPVAEPTDPTKEGYIFDGWHIDTDCKIPYDFSTIVVADTHLYAHWIPAGTFKGEINGNIIDNTGNAVSGYTATLWSRPVSDTTNGAGNFALGDAHYIEHTLHILNGATPVRTYGITFVLGTSPSSVVDEGTSTIVVNYTADTLGISIPLRLDASGTTAVVNGGRVVFDQRPVTNPRTDDNTFNYIYIIFGIIVLLLAGIVLMKKTLLAK